MLIRAVVGLSDQIAISTGCPATMMGADWPRILPANSSPAPETPSHFRTSRRDRVMRSQKTDVYVHAYAYEYVYE
jgi:hypothetical protein